MSDANELEVLLAEMRSRFRNPPGSIDIGPGWWGLAVDCHRELLREYPDYELLAVKQKWGLLEIQAAPVPHRGPESWRREDLRRVDEITEIYNRRSASRCEQCGAPGVLREHHRVHQTLCDACDSDPAASMR